MCIRDRVISENCGVNEIRCCRPGLDLLKTTTSFIPDMAIIDAGNQSYDCLNMVHHLRKINPRVYISLITRPEEQEMCIRDSYRWIENDAYRLDADEFERIILYAEELKDTCLLYTSRCV